jgi:hypothetical protein
LSKWKEYGPEKPSPIKSCIHCGFFCKYKGIRNGYNRGEKDEGHAWPEGVKLSITIKFNDAVHEMTRKGTKKR